RGLIVTGVQTCALPISKRKILVFGHGRNPINFVSVTDVAALVELAVADQALSGRTISLGGPDDVTFEELADTVMAVTGLHGRVVHIPRTMLRLMSVAARPFSAQFARMAQASVVMDTEDMT